MASFSGESDICEHYKYSTPATDGPPRKYRGQMPWLHRDKTRVQMLTKMFPHLKLLCGLFMGPRLSFDT
jgi:hypothetical protein